MVGPKVALNVGVAVADEVHGARSAEWNPVVGIVAVVGRTEVLELEASWDVNVRVAASLVGVPEGLRDALVDVRSLEVPVMAVSALVTSTSPLSKVSHAWDVELVEIRKLDEVGT